MYKLLCADVRRLCSYKVWWLVGFIVAVFSEILFCMVVLWVAKRMNMEGVYADIILTLYPSAATFILGAFVGIYVGTEFQEGTLRNKIISGAKRSHIFGAITVIMMTVAVILQLAATGLGLFVGNIILDGFYMNMQQIGNTTMVYAGACAAIAALFTTVVFAVGSGRVSAVICVMIATSVKFVCTEVISELYPVSGECALTGGLRAVYSFFDRYVPFSYLNGGVRYEMECYAIGVAATVCLTVVVGLVIFQKKDMN